MYLEQSEMTYKTTDFNTFRQSSKNIENRSKEKLDLEKIQIESLEIKKSNIEIKKSLNSRLNSRLDIVNQMKSQ